MVCRVDNVDVGECLRQVLGLAHVVDHLPHGPERRHRHEVRLHETAGRFLGVLQVALEGRSLPGRHLREDLLLLRLIEVFQQISGVVRFQLGDCFCKNTFRQLVQKLVAHGAIEFGQNFRVETHQPNERISVTRCIGLQQLDDVGQIGRPHVVRQARSLGRISGVEGFGDQSTRLAALFGLLLGFAHDLVLLGHRPA